AIFKITQQLTVPSVSHVARPDNLGAIDICVVIDPLMVNVVLRSVAYDDKLPAGKLLELVQQCRSLQVAARPCRFNASMREHGPHAQQNHSARQRRDRANQRLSYGASPGVPSQRPMPKV